MIANTERRTSYETITLTRMIGALGAEVSGIDLRQPLSAQAIAEIRHAFLAHQLLVFRDQDITIEQQKAFGRAFGPLHVHPMFGAVDGHPEVLEFVKEKEDTVNVGGGWHSDLTSEDEPPMAGILRITETPASGGDTLFADMYGAYEALSPAMKRLLEGLIAVHISAKVYGPFGKYAQAKGKTHAPTRADAPMGKAAHPVVRTHPETGRKCLFVNRAYTMFIREMSLEESTAILEFLYQHCVRGEFTSRVHWRTHTMAFWDNRCTQHYALNDYHGHRRAARRVTIDGDRPV
jgi:taurine dioxygenase